MKTFKLCLVSAALAMLSACATLEFNDEAALVVQGITGAVATGNTLVSTGKISKEDGQNIAKQADNIKEGLDVAITLHQTDATGGEDKIASLQAGLSALTDYLTKRQANNGQ